MSIKPIIKEAYKDLIWNISRGELNSALAGLRHLLESICDFLYFEYNSKELIARDLAEKITKVVDMKGFPKEIKSQIKSIQYLSNVGHHNKSIESRYFLQPALISLSYVLRWIFEEVLKESAPSRYFFYEYLQTDNGLILKYFLPNGSYLFEEKVIENSPLEYDHQDKIAFLKRNDFNIFIVIPSSLTSEIIVRPDCEYLRDRVSEMITERLQAANLSKKYSVMVISDFLYYSYDFISLQNAILIGTHENQLFTSIIHKGIEKEKIHDEFYMIEHFTKTYLVVKTKYRHYIGSEIDRLLRDDILPKFVDKLLNSSVR